MSKNKIGSHQKIYELNSQGKNKEEHGDTVIQVVEFDSNKQSKKNTPPISNLPSHVQTPPYSKMTSGSKKQSGVHQTDVAKNSEGNKQFLTIKDPSQLNMASKLDKVKSSAKLGRESAVSQQRRMRLR